MLTLKKYLTPENPDKNLRVDNLFLVLRINLVAHILALPLVVFPIERALVGLPLFVLSLCYTLLMFYVARRGNFYIASVAVVVEVWLFLMVFTLFNGGVTNLSYSSDSVLVILIAAFLLDRRETLTAFVAVVACGGLLVWLENHHHLPESPNPDFTPMSSFIATFLFLLTATGLLLAATNSIRTLLESHRAELLERQKTTAALQLSEQRYRMLVENLPYSSTILFDHDLRLLLADGPEVELAGNTKAGLEGKTLYEALPPEFAKLAEPNMRAVLAGQQFSAELPFGDQYHAYNYVPLRNASGEVVLGLIVAQNITERKRLELELQRYTQQLEQMVEARTADLRTAKDQIEVIIENTRDAIALVQDNGDVQLVNPAFRAMFNEQAAAAVEEILSCVPELPAIEAVADGLVGAIVERRPKSLATRIQSSDGLARDIDLALVPVNSANEQHPGMILSAHDITHHKELERLKEQFVANAVHDLSTPITALSFRLNLLKSMPDQLERHVQSLERQVEHLRHLLEDMRMLSQLDRGVVELELVPTDLNEMVRRVFDTYEPVALAKNQQFDLKIDATLPPVIMDVRQMERVILNLVSNAINYTDENKIITVQTYAKEGFGWFMVQDEGIGMSENDRQHVFERFYRSAEARKTRSTGSGLGMAIAKEIVDLHGGVIKVESNLGMGTTIAVALRL